MTQPVIDRSGDTYCNLLRVTSFTFDYRAPDPATIERARPQQMYMGDHDFHAPAPMSAGTTDARLSSIALDLNLALEGASGPTRTRVQRALAGIDEMMRELRLLAVLQAGNGESGAGRRQG